MPYKFFHPGEQFENYEKNEGFLENAAFCSPSESTPHPHLEGTWEQNNL
jgi:guanylate kinase